MAALHVAVPRFFFHLINDIDVKDDEGKDLPDLAAARAFAIGQALALIGETVRDQGRVVLHHRIDIEDGGGTVLDSVVFRDVVTVEE